MLGVRSCYSCCSRLCRSGEEDLALFPCWWGIVSSRERLRWGSNKWQGKGCGHQDLAAPPPPSLMAHSLVPKVFPVKNPKSILFCSPFISMEKSKRKEIQERKAKTPSTNGKKMFFTMIQQDFQWAPGCRRAGSLPDTSQPSSLA